MSQPLVWTAVFTEQVVSTVVTGYSEVTVSTIVEVTVDVAITSEPAACLGTTATAALELANEATTVKSLIVNDSLWLL